MVPRRMYAVVAGSWSAVFGLVGLAFLVVPARVGDLIALIARALHLSGTVEVQGGPLWWVLSLSLMLVLTLLAAESARRPGDPLPFRVLIASKLASTAGFAALALGGAPAWWLCALADGFVAATLCAARLADGCCPTDAAPVPGLDLTHPTP